MMKILVLFPYQWGYNTDYLFYSKLLAEKFEVTYVGYDLGLPPVPAEGVRLLQIKHTGKLSILSLYRTVFNELKSGGYSHLFVNYFMSCSLLTWLLPGQIKKIVDVRTSFIYPGQLKTWFFNKAMRIEVSMFKNITVVSGGVRSFLQLPARAHILPLGGPLFPLTDKSFAQLRFLYVGTFYDRNIANTIAAFKLLVDSHGDKASLRYTIIGHGTDAEEKQVTSAIYMHKLEQYITYEGTIRYPELNAWFNSHNVGISYIPLTAYYDCQPPTKTFEYILSGNVVLGTNTTENRRVVNEENGVLVGDTVQEFYDGMVQIYDKRFSYESKQIQQEASPYSWSAIVQDNLIPYLMNCK